LKTEYLVFYQDAVNFALGLTKGTAKTESRQRMRYWSALALLRGIMSSPAAGNAMLANRLAGHTVPESELTDDDTNPVMDGEFDLEKDHPSSHLIQKTDWSAGEVKQLRQMSDRLQSLSGTKFDAKISDTITVLKDWIPKRFNPVIFCRYIATANYVGNILKKELSKHFKNIDIQIVTSEEPDDARKLRIDGMQNSSQRVLVATDCLSEGINLQDKFTAVLHYDLPWNPNRLEQREGRIDRFGQTAPEVKAYLLYGKNNPIDGVVLRVLLRKVREIRRSIGISLPFPEDSQSLMDSVLQAVLLKQKDEAIQTSLDFGEFEETQKKELQVTHAIDKAADREKLSRTIFAQHSIKAEEIEKDLQEADEAVGEPEAVEEFVVEALNCLLGVQVTRHKKGYLLFPQNLPVSLKTLLPDSNKIKITFHSPTPKGYLYLGRNHVFVEQLCQFLTAKAMTRDKRFGPARSAVIRTAEVKQKTTILLFRVRSVIQEKESNRQLVAEEMLVWGFKGPVQSKTVLTFNEAMYMLKNVMPTANMTDESRAVFLKQELRDVEILYKSKELDMVANKRAEVLVKAHERFRKVMAGSRYKVVEPVLPMDLLGIYIFLPDRSGGRN
jgi:superfamily II DNA/RNA helicase